MVKSGLMPPPAGGSPLPFLETRSSCLTAMAAKLVSPCSFCCLRRAQDLPPTPLLWHRKCLPNFSSIALAEAASTAVALLCVRPVWSRLLPLATPPAVISAACYHKDNTPWRQKAWEERAAGAQSGLSWGCSQHTILCFPLLHSQAAGSESLKRSSLL